MVSVKEGVEEGGGEVGGGGDGEEGGVEAVDAGGELEGLRRLRLRQVEGDGDGAGRGRWNALVLQSQPPSLGGDREGKWAGNGGAGGLAAEGAGADGGGHQLALPDPLRLRLHLNAPKFPNKIWARLGNQIQ